jgi:bifunctional non-homologous end joining protein LigD
MTDKLDTYRSMRDFGGTPEPEGGSAPEGGRSRFVIQEHHATRLHWDLRLERDGVLVSWAIPNGLPEDPGENRKAVHTEDHPLSYYDFEGEIPEGNYGAGQVLLWDQGTYECHKWEPRKVVVTFHGRRARGRYALFRAGGERDWMIHRMDPPEDPAREPMPERLLPMLARSASLPEPDGDYAFEIKWDGIRALAYSEPGRLRLETRNLNEVTARYPELRALNRALSSHSAILDGEIVAFDEQGRPSFERLQGRMHLTSESHVRRRAASEPVVYVIFDLLYLDGHSLMELPYAERRERLLDLGLRGASWQTPAHRLGGGRAFLEASRAQGLEGVIAKRLDSRYEPGRRSPAWLKVKNSARQELVICGWLPGEGRREQRIGALLVGWFDPERPDEDGNPSLRYAGKVGTGFDERELDRLAGLLGPLRREDSPFQGRQPGRGAVFVEPCLVAEIEFTEWTAQGLLRHPSYKGLREDRDPRSVVRERPQAPGAGASADPGQAAGAIAAGNPSAAPPAPPFDYEVSGVPALGVRAEGREAGAEATVEGRSLRLTNLGKVLYPRAGFTKGALIDYYVRVAPVLLPHLRDRPLTLKRYPNGVEGEHFYEKQCPSHRPGWVATAPVPSRHRRSTINFCLANDLPTLAWTSNLADIELHTSLSLASIVERPTVLAFDLDPGAPAGIVQCCEVGLLLRGMFEHLGLRSFPKTSGSKGLQVYVPLNTQTSYAHTKPFARAVAELLERTHPDLVVSRMTKSLRAGKVLVDWSQNDEHKTTVNVYSLRARERPTVSTPVTWEEVEATRAAGDPERLVFEARDVLERVESQGDLFAPVVSERQELPRLTG